MEQSRYDARERARVLADEALRKGDAVGWFEQLYVEAAGDEGRIPWADPTGHPLLVEWLARERVEGRGRKALVIGCGLGEDAETLAHVGFDVTAFDISPTAVDWCRQRFPKSRVRYEVGDLLTPPAHWSRAFEFVFEGYTLQALPPEPRKQAVACIASCVAPNGELLIVTRGRDGHEPLGEIPWPLTRDELRAFPTHGLAELEFDDVAQSGPPTRPTRHFRARFRRAT